MDDDGSEWMWFLGPLAMTVWFALLALLVWWIVTLVNRRAAAATVSSRKDPGSPEEILATRFARGEIGADEFREARAQLREQRGPSS
ncbi:SHOCT domain-containing protein [Yinghuangia seranimata]|uniref:SHOCT domain-containing protein n=1 Tax=Yinghuangia seranimata TaxID=408067 RepID=UPI00248CDF43|nr:SHOCT domain-containing protein [Yinghuangia seranimata]MDI2130497.1 SHOCT domain-containing protein [Yinghuangia seranimata]